MPTKNGPHPTGCDPIRPGDGSLVGSLASGPAVSQSQRLTERCGESEYGAEQIPSRDPLAERAPRVVPEGGALREAPSTPHADFHLRRPPLRQDELGGGAQGQECRRLRRQASGAGLVTDRDLVQQLDELQEAGERLIGVLADWPQPVAAQSPEDAALAHYLDHVAAVVEDRFRIGRVVLIVPPVANLVRVLAGLDLLVLAEPISDPGCRAIDGAIQEANRLGYHPEVVIESSADGREAA